MHRTRKIIGQSNRLPLIARLLRWNGPRENLAFTERCDSQTGAVGGPILFRDLW